MRKIAVKKISYVMLISLLSGCSYYASQGEALYLQSTNGRNLQVPPKVADKNISHFYDLPAQNQNAQVSIAPPADTAISKAA
jgi:uncharacterized lipoprotein